MADAIILSDGAPATTVRSVARLARLRESLAGWSLAGPAAFLMGLLLIGPALGVVALSLTDWQLGARTLSFVGLGNYAALAQDRVFWTSLTNTLVYVAVVVPGSVALGLGAALLVEAGDSLKSFYRAVYFLPVMATLIAMAVVWEFVLHPSLGLLNLALAAVGIEGANWLRDEGTVLFVLCGIGIWQAVGFNMVLFMAGLTAVPRDLYDAADVDGADSAWSRFRLVTWPLLGPVTMFVVVITAIRAFQVFDTVKVLTEGGPNKATEVLLHTVFTEAFSFFRTGYAAAITVVFVAFVLALTLLQSRVLERRVHYS